MEEFNAETRRQYLAEFDAQHRWATMNALSQLTQTTTVAAFRAAFEDLMQGVTGISEPLLITFFILGLQPDLRRELRHWTMPDTLRETFALAHACEARVEKTPEIIVPTRQSIALPSVSSPNPFPSPKITTPPPTPPPLTKSSPVPSTPSKTLSDFPFTSPIISSGSLSPILTSSVPVPSTISPPKSNTIATSISPSSPFPPPDPSRPPTPSSLSSNPVPSSNPLPDPPSPDPPPDEQKQDIAGQRISSESAAVSRVEESETVKVSLQAGTTSPLLITPQDRPPRYHNAIVLDPSFFSELSVAVHHRDQIISNELTTFRQPSKPPPLLAEMVSADPSLTELGSERSQSNFPLLAWRMQSSTPAKTHPDPNVKEEVKPGPPPGPKPDRNLNKEKNQVCSPSPLIARGVQLGSNHPILLHMLDNTNTDTDITCKRVKVTVALIPDDDVVVSFSTLAGRMVRIAKALAHGDIDKFDRVRVPSPYLVSLSERKGASGEYHNYSEIQMLVCREEIKFGLVLLYFWNGNRFDYLCAFREEHVNAVEKILDEMHRNVDAVEISWIGFPRRLHVDLPKKLCDHGILLGDLSYRILLPEEYTTSVGEQKTSAEKVFAEMSHKSFRTCIHLKSFALVAVFINSAGLLASMTMEFILREVRQHGFESKVIEGTALSNAYVRYRNVMDFYTVLAVMNSSNLVSSHGIILAIALHDLFEESLQLFKRKWVIGVTPNLLAKNEINYSYKVNGSTEQCNSGHAYIVGLGAQISMSNADIEMSLCLGNIEIMMCFFSKLNVKIGKNVKNLKIFRFCWDAGGAAEARDMYRLPFVECLVCWTFISATAPVTVLAIFQELGTGMNFYALVFGQSVLNEAMAISLSRAMSSVRRNASTGQSLFMVILSILAIFVGSIRVDDVESEPCVLVNFLGIIRMVLKVVILFPHGYSALEALVTTQEPKKPPDKLQRRPLPNIYKICGIRAVPFGQFETDASGSTLLVVEVNMARHNVKNGVDPWVYKIYEFLEVVEPYNPTPPGQAADIVSLRHMRTAMVAGVEMFQKLGKLYSISHLEDKVVFDAAAVIRPSRQSER